LLKARHALPRGTRSTIHSASNAPKRSKAKLTCQPRSRRPPRVDRQKLNRGSENRRAAAGAPRERERHKAATGMDPARRDERLRRQPLEKTAPARSSAPTPVRSGGSAPNPARSGGSAPTPSPDAGFRRPSPTGPDAGLRAKRARLRATPVPVSAGYELQSNFIQKTFYSSANNNRKERQLQMFVPENGLQN
jgi:hypothetical protein